MTDFSEDPNTGLNNSQFETKPFLFKVMRLLVVASIVLALVSLALIAFIKDLNQAPIAFPTNQPITIDQGLSVKAITSILKDNNVVKSDALLYYLLVLFYDPSVIKASTYVFDEPMTTNQIAKRLSEGDFDTDLIKFTHIEGEKVTKLAERASIALPAFNQSSFIEKAQPYEGKLYPDTYFVPPTYTEEELLNLMLSTFEDKTAPLRSKIESSYLSEDEIIILASIIEREANSPESMKLVSGILQNRLRIGMALQADASIEYVLDKPLSELTPEDLEIDSPYNTYLYPGLPPTPISNPGLDAIEAVLEPTKSDYFYYITGNDGEFYYAETYNQHLNNIERYLR